MPDIVTPERRSRMMAGIRGKNTKPELLIRGALFKQGFRFRKHVASMAGAPDIVLPKHRAVVFVNGCFWHRHTCHLFKWPSSNVPFWRQKIDRNVVVNRTAIRALRSAGWRVFVVWECALKGRSRKPLDAVIASICNWLLSERKHGQIAGKRERSLLREAV